MPSFEIAPDCYSMYDGISNTLWTMEARRGGYFCPEWRRCIPETSTMFSSVNKCQTCVLPLVRVITEPLQRHSAVDTAAVIITAEIKVSPQTKLE